VNEPLSGEELAAIRKRAQESPTSSYTDFRVYHDRVALLAELDRLRAENEVTREKMPVVIAELERLLDENTRLLTENAALRTAGDVAVGAVNRLGAQVAAMRLIEENRLIVRPTVTGQWGAGRFARVSLNNRMEAVPETWTEAKTLEEAIRLAAEKGCALLAKGAQE
jgi:hypothetical protein